MKTYIIIVLLGFQCAYGQINDKIISASERNKEKRKSTKKVRSYSSSSSYSDSDYSIIDNVEMDGESCTECCNGIADMCEFIGEGLYNANMRIKERDTIITRINSLSGDFLMGFLTPNSRTMVPRLTLNGALFATDFRYFSNYEMHLDEDLHYSTCDWQILIFNLLVQQEVNFRIGTGLMFENVSDITFNEHTLRLDIYPFWWLETSLEYRLTPDYKTGMMVRQEFDFGLGLTLFDWEHFSIEFKAIYQSATYYEEVNFNSFCFGVGLNLY